MISVVCAVLKKGSCLLVAKRPAHKKEGLKWEFPGGKVEDGESEEEALQREILEELSIDVIPRERIAVTNIAGSAPMQLIAWLCTPKSGKIRLTEHVAFRWVDFEELEELELSKGDKELLPVLKFYFDNS